MFDAMVESIREDTIRMLLTVRIQKNAPIQREQVAKPDAPNAGSIRMTKKKPADNDPCPCGSGKKYKKCCGMKEQQQLKLKGTEFDSFPFLLCLNHCIHMLLQDISIKFPSGNC